MKIEVHLFASLKGHASHLFEEGPWIDLPEGATLREVLDRIALPKGAYKLIFKNGLHAEETSLLQEGDRIGIFPPVAGG